MSAIKILVIEDDELIAQDISQNLTKAGYEVIGNVDSCTRAMEIANNNLPDLAFLDIEIAGDKDGIETAKELQKIGEFPFIFLTQFSDTETIKRAFDVKPANYLNKPFTGQQLIVSIQLALFNASHGSSGNTIAQETIPENIIFKNKLLLKDDKGTFKKYDISEILYIEAGRAYCIIHTTKGKLTQSINMKAMEEKINHPQLIKVHRSYVVNLDAIDGVKGNILLVNDEEVPVSEQYKESVFKLLPFVK
jgi:DNA-binding LytR/AlgR family response regulator